MTPAWTGRLGLIALGTSLAFASAIAAGLAIVEGGLFDATASKPHEPLVAWATHTAMIRSVEVRSPPWSGAPPTPDRVRAGLRLYADNCAICHGGPGVARAPWTAGMNPTPPYLVDVARHWTPAQQHFIISDGVKMTGMPAWRGQLREDEISAVMAALEALPYVTATEYSRVVCPGVIAYTKTNGNKIASAER